MRRGRPFGRAGAAGVLGRRHVERSSDLLFANQTRAALATLEARHAGRNEGGSVILLLLACNGEGERISQKIWDYGRRSLDERWQAGHAAGADRCAGSTG